MIVFLYNPPIFHLGFEFLFPIIFWLPFITATTTYSILSIYGKLKLYFYFYCFFTLLAFILIVLLNGDSAFLFAPIKILFTFLGCLILVSIGFHLFSNKAFVLLAPFALQLIYIYVGLINYELTFPIQSYLHMENYARFESNYLGQRGLSFSDSLAFGLVLQLGVLFFFISYFLNSIRSNLAVLFLLFSFAPLMSAGRTSAIFYLFLIFINYKYLVKLIIAFVLFLLVMALFAGENYFFEIRLFEYVFKSYFDYTLNEELSNSSLDALYNNMLYKINIIDFLIGNAKYYNNDGSYYGLSDSGYYRFLFFFGILLSIGIYISYLFVSIFSFRKIGLQMHIYIPFIFLLFFLHIKGEVINSHSLHSGLLWCLSFFVLFNKKKISDCHLIEQKLQSY